MNPIKLLLFILLCPVGVPVLAQKIVPHSFRYQVDTSGRDQLRFLTQVTQPNTTFLRLYFAGTQLGEGSYLVLEGTDGTRQELRKQDLENWRYSSAYFNGQSVNVSLFEAPGDRNTVTVSGMKVSDESDRLARNGRQAAPTQPGARQAVSIPESLTETYPYAKAVGRFTNGTDSYGTGWIAPNGAIVTAYRMYDYYFYPDPYDVIEFNVPPSLGGTVMHPAPQDQYPLKNRNLPRSSLVYFKDEPKASGHFFWYGWVIFEPLPNGTGLRPGERQQEYFRIAENPGNFTIDAKGSGNIPVDIFHYGNVNGDNLEGRTIYRTLQLLETSLLKQNEYLEAGGNGDRDRFLLYNTPLFIGSDDGAPVTYAGSNVAIGIHNEQAGVISGFGFPGHGLGFRDEAFRNEVSDFYASNSVYVDPEGLYDPGTGEIHKPFRTQNQAATDAPAGAQVYFARGEYYGPANFNRPMTLRAPVGKVTMGVPLSQFRKAAESSIARNVAIAESMGNQSRLENPEMVAKVRAYPNPFREQTEIKYPFAEGGPVSVNILNTAGVSVATFNVSSAASGQNGVYWNGTNQNGTPVPTGLYIISVNDGRQTFTTKILKQ
ncbi:T9SS type A sorting domain-containing protein [Fibrella aquatilis]|uniref:T9SS type A sorting domain-containing protein n=1 Tax=Fibrella aquatilis TaxID=2817059 RepID=A0A939G2H5_9BACT|nr:T9SS type A sorting domain-containing protein [Fibrella aquatilis]MBO0930859.1 T9SS type A sorting domain-containing protein [Fibrella aquatilis]